MFMLHSSEMMPGGSPSFPDEKSIEELYECIEKLSLDVLFFLLTLTFNLSAHFGFGIIN